MQNFSNSYPWLFQQSFISFVIFFCIFWMFYHEAAFLWGHKNYHYLEGRNDAVKESASNTVVSYSFPHTEKKANAFTKSKVYYLFHLYYDCNLVQIQ